MDEWIQRLGMKRAWQYAPTPLLVVSESGEILDWNHSCEDFFEVGRSGLAGATFQKITESESAKDDARLFKECLESERNGYRIQKVFRLANGLKRTAIMFVTYLRKDGVFLASLLPVDQLACDLKDSKKELEELKWAIESKDRELEILRNCAVHGSVVKPG